MLGTGERQEATTLEQIRADHRYRYEWVAKRQHGLVVDAGCGVGYGSKILADAGCTVRGYDYDADAIRLANAHYNTVPSIKYTVGSVYDVSHPKHADAVVAFELLEHLTKPEVALRRWHEMAPLLYVSVPNEDVFPYRGRFRHHVRHYTRDQLNELLLRNGWRVTEWHGQGGTESYVEPDVHGRTLVAVAERFDAPIPIEQLAPDDVLESLRLPGRELPTSVAIVALGASNHEFLSEVGRRGTRRIVADETWLINNAAAALKGDRLFIMDDIHIQEERSKLADYVDHMVTWLKDYPPPVYTPRVYPGYKGLVEYPLEWVLNKTDHCYFEDTSPPYAIAMAIAMGVKTIKLYGLDYGWTGQVSRERGRGCVEYWVAIAKERGIEVAIPAKSSLLNYNGNHELYGYDTEWLTINRDGSGKWEVGRVDRLPKDVPSALEIEHRYSHDPAQERLEIVAKQTRRFKNWAAELAATTQEK